MNVTVHNPVKSYGKQHMSLFMCFVLGTMAVGLGVLYSMFLMWLLLGDPAPQLPALGYTALVELLLMSFGATVWAICIAANATVQELPGRRATRWLIAPYAVCFLATLAVLVVAVSR